MAETTYVALGLLAVVLIVYITALIRKKKVRGMLRLPGMAWDLQTDNEAVDEQDRANKTSTTSTAAFSDAAVHFGQSNKLSGKIGDVAGGHIIETSNKGAHARPAQGTYGVHFGEGNDLSGEIGDVAGGSIEKAPDSSRR